MTVLLGISNSPAVDTDHLATIPLTLKDYREMVVQHNETIKARMFGAEAAGRLAKGELGKFEPVMVGSIDRIVNNRPNTVEEQRTLNGVPIFQEKNWDYETGIESLVPSGGKVRFGYTLRYLKNNLQDTPSLFGGTTGPEYQTFLGATLIHPLLKNAGPDATFASIREAALGSSVAFQEYRRQFAIIISTAEATYWKLYYAQEQLRFLNEAVKFAEMVLRDSQARLDSGKGSELYVLEAKSGLALRKTKQNEALQNLYDTQAQAVTLYGGSSKGGMMRIEAVDRPSFVAPESVGTYAADWQECLTRNQDLLIQSLKLDIEDVRLRYAKNQRRLELNLKAAYGMNGLGSSMESAWNEVPTTQFPAWSVGVEVRIPLGGGIQTKNALQAAKLSRDQAMFMLNSTENQSSNALRTAIPKVRTTEEIARSYEEIERVNQRVLDSQLEGLRAGKVEPRKVFEAEADLFEARAGLANAMVQHKLSFLELEVVEGTTLKNRGLDLTQAELRARTEALRAGKRTKAKSEKSTPAPAPAPVPATVSAPVPKPTPAPALKPVPAPVPVPTPAPVPKPTRAPTTNFRAGGDAAPSSECPVVKG